jgi:hypothetical protein
MCILKGHPCTPEITCCSSVCLGTTCF